MLRSIHVALLLCAVVLCGIASTANAEVRFGIRAGEYTDVSEPFIGAEVITPLTSRWFFNPNLEWVFVEGGDLATLNFDFHYDFRTGSRAFVWAGAGAAVVYENFNESDTNLGGNVLAGVGWKVGEVVPYVQIKGLLGDRDDFVIMGGLRF